MNTTSRPTVPRAGLGRALRPVATTAALALLLGLAGCHSREHYQVAADKEVYQILEEKWEKDFGPMTNYQISDQTPNGMEIVGQIPDPQRLSLAEAVTLATQHSRAYQDEKESLYLSSLGLTDTRHQYARQWFGVIDAAYVTDAGNNDDSRIGGDPSRQNKLFGVNQSHLLGDSLFITTGLAVDWVQFLSGDTRKTLASVLTATVSAPLVGFGEAKDRREQLTLAERRVLYAIRNFSRYRKTFVVDTIEAYYGVLQRRNEVLIQEASYRSRIESTNQLRMEVEVGQRPAYDLGEAEQNLLSAEQGLVTVRQRYDQTLDGFKLRLALPTDTEISLDPDELNLLEQEGIEQTPYSVEEAIKIALERRLDLANTRGRLDDETRNLELRAQELGVQLGLSAGAGGVRGTPLTDIEFDQGRYELGLNADLGLDQKTQRNNYREALIGVQRQQRAYEEQVDQIKLSVRDAFRNMVNTAETYRIQQIGLRLAQQRVEVEKLSLQYGRGTVRLLLESEDALVEAQNAVIQALVDHTIAKLRFFQDVGVLQVKPDGMWEQNTL